MGPAPTVAGPKSKGLAKIDDPFHHKISVTGGRGVSDSRVFQKMACFKNSALFGHVQMS